MILTKALSVTLGVQEDEFGFGVKRYSHCLSLFIFDRAKGGAGYSNQFSIVAEEVFRNALDLLECDCQQACTKCLIDRNSQWFIERLDRHKAKTWLLRVINHRIPDDLLEEIPDLRLVMGTTMDDIHRMTFRNIVSEIWLFVDNNTAGWDLESFTLNSLKYKPQIKTHFVVRSELEFSGFQDRISAIQVTSWANILIDRNNYTRLNPLCQVKLVDGTYRQYYALEADLSLNNNWGLAHMHYMNISRASFTFNPVNVEIPSQDLIQDIIIKTCKPFNSNLLADMLFNEYKRKNEVLRLMHGKNFRVHCGDRYLRTPLGCILLLQFIKRVSEITGCIIDSINLDVIEIQEPYTYEDHLLIFKDYRDSRSREVDIQDFARKLNLPDPVINSRGQFPHYRSIQFDTIDYSLTLRPDAGIDHGWRNIRSNNRANLNLDDFVLVKRVDYNLLFTIFEKEK